MKDHVEGIILLKSLCIKSCRKDMYGLAYKKMWAIGVNLVKHFKLWGVEF